MNSLRARLLLALFALVAVTSIAAGVFTYRRVLAETSGLFDYQLRQMALSLRDQATIGPGVVLPSHGSGGDFIIQIWDLFGQQVYQAPAGGPFINRAILGYSDLTLEGERWRVYSLASADSVIQVAQPWRVREQRAQAAALRMIAGLLVLLLAMALAIVWVVNRGLAPLKRLTAEVQTRSAASLEPVTAPQLPSEVAPLIEELNRLLARLKEAFGQQRAFVADAAHELRSPLTALSLQLQLLDRAPDETARTEARTKLGAAVERAIHLATQLLTLARHEPTEAATEGTALVPIALAPCVHEGIADVATLAAERGVELREAFEPDVEVRGDADALRILTRNLVDNAVRYTPRGGSVAVSVR
ncbi:MAG TPA: histidine kinase dimerization/phospho-acceptor domain-containing protein, partial [Steroidobacteraceae bacterium]|nr:histidine kinase dimerization/phospho-acceptor domain-containing protein [Steroidobacteraceae bacterium]